VGEVHAAGLARGVVKGERVAIQGSWSEKKDYLQVTQGGAQRLTMLGKAEREGEDHDAEAKNFQKGNSEASEGEGVAGGSA